MAGIKQTPDFIENDCFMGLLAAEGLIPGTTAKPIQSHLRAKNEIFEIVGEKKTAKRYSLRIVRPLSWGGVAAQPSVAGAMANL